MPATTKPSPPPSLFAQQQPSSNCCAPPTPPRYVWQPAVRDDIPTIHYVSQIVHPAFPEGIEVFYNRLECYPKGFLKLVDTRVQEQRRSTLAMKQQQEVGNIKSSEEGESNDDDNDDVRRDIGYIRDHAHTFAANGVPPPQRPTAESLAALVAEMTLSGNSSPQQPSGPTPQLMEEKKKEGEEEQKEQGPPLTHASPLPATPAPPTSLYDPSIVGYAVSHPWHGLSAPPLDFMFEDSASVPQSPAVSLLQRRNNKRNAANKRRQQKEGEEGLIAAADGEEGGEEVFGSSSGVVVDEDAFGDDNGNEQDDGEDRPSSCSGSDSCDEDDEEIDENAAWFYFHDCAIAPYAHNSGGGKAIVDLLLALGRAEGFTKMALTSVNNSSGYWAKRGFTALEPHQHNHHHHHHHHNSGVEHLRPSDAFYEKLKANYGEDAKFMVIDLTQ